MIRKTIQNVREMRDRLLDTWENRDAIKAEASRDMKDLPERWRGRDGNQTATIAVFALVVVAVIVLTVL
jgi:hypothetical protein